MHSYPFYVADWRGSESVQAMTLEAQGAYRNLLDHAWERGSLPTNPRALQLIAMATDAEWARVWPVVSAQFDERDGRLFNAKVDEKRPAIVDAKADRQQSQQASNRRHAGGIARAAGAERDAAGHFLPAKPASEPAMLQQPASIQLPSNRITVLPNSDVVRKPQAVEFSTAEEKPEEIRRTVNGPELRPNAADVLKPMSKSRNRAQAAPAELGEWLRGAIALEDADAVNRLWAACRARDPEATVEEVARVVCGLRPKWTSASVSNPIGLMLTIVPLEFGDGGKAELRRVRETIGQLRRMRESRG